MLDHIAHPHSHSHSLSHTHTATINLQNSHMNKVSIFVRLQRTIPFTVNPLFFFTSGLLKSTTAWWHTFITSIKAEATLGNIPHTKPTGHEAAAPSLKMKGCTVQCHQGADGVCGWVTTTTSVNTAALPIPKTIPNNIPLFYDALVYRSRWWWHFVLPMN